MLHIFAEPGDISGDRLTITGKEYNHIRNVLRMKQGEIISVSDGQDGRDYRFAIDGFTDSQVLCRLVSVAESGAELPVRVVLFQGIPKGDKMDLIVQKCVELGVTDIVPVEMKRCVVRLDAGKKAKRVRRWQTIAESAAGQSRRAVIPQVHEPMTMEAAVRGAAENTDVRLLPYELQGEGGTRELFDRIRSGSAVSVFIGPEGGFEASEVEAAGRAGILPITLGPRILRTETAAMVVLSWLIWRFEIA